MTESLPPHQCRYCGLLGLRAKSGKLVEADEDYRKGQDWNGTLFPSLPPPICAAMRVDFSGFLFDRLRKQLDTPEPFESEFSAREHNPTREDVHAFLWERRKCFPTEARHGWTEHQPGLTPKEHREMLDREFRVKREDARDADQRDWQERVQARVEEKADKRHTRELWIIGGVVTTIVVLATILAALIEVTWGGDTIIIPQPQVIVMPSEVAQPTLDIPAVQPSEAPEERPGR